MDKKKLGEAELFCPTQTEVVWPTSFACLKICTLDMTMHFLCAYIFQGHIVFDCALQNQYYPFKTNKPGPIARFRVQIAQLSLFLNRNFEMRNGRKGRTCMRLN